jgi:protein-tyrosine phosphatase
VFDLTTCHVERNEQQDYLLRWQCARPGTRVSIYMSDDPEQYYREDHPGTPVAQTTASEALVANPDKAVRHYFYLESECGEGAIIAERQLSLQGTPNFRDLGGYETAEGRRLRWGKLYRSSKLSALTDADQRYVHRLGLSLICDFRQVMEQDLEPTLLSDAGQPLLASLPVTPGSSRSFIDNLHNGIIAVDDAHGFMEEINRDFVANQLPQYAEMFRLILSGDQPVLIHCASGKDRTGFGAALILDVLGVDEDVIVQDYLLTNRYLPVDQEVERLSQQVTDEGGAPVPEEVLRPLLELRPDYIKACFEEIRRRYESKEHFFATALELDPDKVAMLKERYLED